MVKRRVNDDEQHIHFVTFSCYKRRRYLHTDFAKRIVIGQLRSRLALWIQRLVAEEVGRKAELHAPLPRESRPESDEFDRLDGIERLDTHDAASCRCATRPTKLAGPPSISGDRR